MMKAVTAILFAAACGAASAGERTFYNEKGQMTGTATQNGAMTTFRNEKGQITGTATRSGGGTIYYDANGRERGRSSR